MLRHNFHAQIGAKTRMHFCQTKMHLFRQNISLCRTNMITYLHLICKNIFCTLSLRGRLRPWQFDETCNSLRSICLHFCPSGVTRRRFVCVFPLGVTRRRFVCVFPLGVTRPEIRLHFRLCRKLRCCRGPYPASNSPPDCCI